MNIKKVITLPWLVIGDFNEIISADEVRGGIFVPYMVARMINVIDTCQLMDIGCSGTKFTWIRVNKGTRMAKRLDRALADSAWLVTFPEAYAEALCRVYFDHCPILVRSGGIKDNHRVRPFRFQAAWTSHKDYNQVVRKAWEKSSPNLCLSLKQVEKDSLKFNKEVFGNIFKRKSRVIARLNGVHKALEEHESSDLNQLEKVLQDEYNNILLQEEYIWFQKSREQWVRFGDRNTKFFHTQTLVRRKRNKIHGLYLNDGT
uniref:Endonuclease/exonuclease/phosphatase domain-containing protein n=1 Tax=Cajanus cajan TaxID=3821 RepID=A0A151R5G6_CAJCA|nr:hypothetical protein KK1_041039 [Cajanus cajan]